MLRSYSRYEEVESYLIETATAGEDPDEMDIDEPRGKPLALAIKAAAFKALGMCWPRNADAQGMLFIKSTTISNPSNLIIYPF